MGGLMLVPRRVLGGTGFTAPSDQVRLAGIGVGGVGFGQLQECEQAGFSIAALCDVDDVYARKAFEKWPAALRYRDFRELLDRETDIDAVYVGTPDHTHAVIVMGALRKRKHVCCVKPLTRTLHESRVVVEEARRAGVATQVTAMPNTSEKACRTCELIWAGALGQVREVHVWSGRPWWPQGMQPRAGEDPVPPTLDWDLWIGPARMRPFQAEWPEGHYALEQVNSSRPKDLAFRAVYHPWNFRGWWDFGTGSLGDMGCHYLNTVYRALKLANPESIHASSTRVFAETAPLASIVTYDFPARKGMDPVRVVWYDGGLKPPVPEGVDALSGEGTLYIGTEASMLDGKVLSPKRARKFESVRKTLPRRSGTWGEWLEACKGGEAAGCNFEWAERLTDFVLLGNIAIQTGKRLGWDPGQRRFTSEDAANELLHYEYRQGWEL